MVWALSWSATSHRAQYSQEMWLTRNCYICSLLDLSCTGLQIPDFLSTLQSCLPAIIPAPRRYFCGQEASSPFPWKNTERNVSSSLTPQQDRNLWNQAGLGSGVCAWVYVHGLIQLLVTGSQALCSPHAGQSLIMRTAIVLSLPALCVTEHCLPPCVWLCAACSSPEGRVTL